MGGIEVVDPIGNRAEHRDDVLFPGHSGNDYGVRAHATRHTIADFKSDPGPRWQADAGQPTEELADPVTQPGRPAVAIEQAVERAMLCWVGLSERIHGLQLRARSGFPIIRNRPPEWPPAGPA